MIRKTHSLYSNADTIDQRLAVEIGNSHIVLVAGAAGKITGLEFYDVEEMDLEQVFDDIKHQSQLLEKPFSETNVYYNISESVLIPAAQFNTSIASELVDVAFGSKVASQVNVENINVSPGIVNVYRSNDNWQAVMNRYFRALTKRHIYSNLVQHAVNNDEDICVQFYKDEMIVVAVSDNGLKLVRNFGFGNDADVLYHLLNVCKQADIDVMKASVGISGFIDTDSTVYRLLQQYLNLKLNTVTENSLPEELQQQYPLHYFTPFFNLLS